MSDQEGRIKPTTSAEEEEKGQVIVKEGAAEGRHKDEATQEETEGPVVEPTDPAAPSGDAQGEFDTNEPVPPDHNYRGKVTYTSSGRPKPNKPSKP
ncbi:hypothetical protein Moror_4109 [Moniliophthora roreri MCA 2997]|uniref:Uncharacterized protein n=2 Tax=Moniliophthora roreri TaxID=221103 RepID=V2WV58_MONRO|nr:hypothetical protein Moror_4109 [Moniliophthora roreri MCA 2997]KAI3600406.1 hypothetical protein WG66_001695 [Moniliophthora roreri]